MVWALKYTLKHSQADIKIWKPLCPIGFYALIWGARTVNPVYVAFGSWTLSVISSFSCWDTIIFISLSYSESKSKNLLSHRKIFRCHKLVVLTAKIYSATQKHFHIISLSDLKRKEKKKANGRKITSKLCPCQRSSTSDNIWSLFHRFVDDISIFLLFFPVSKEQPVMNNARWIIILNIYSIAAVYEHTIHTIIRDGL